MGRMLDALKRAGGGSGEPEERRIAMPGIGIPSPTVETSEGEEEIPFIEVGPRKSMEASPSVLACAPTAPPSPPTEPLPIATRTVQFRALPSYRERSSSFAAELVAFHAPQQREARQYQVVLDAVRTTCASGPEATVLLFTASRTRIGNTTTVLNLAITAAREGRERILVVDAHLRQPAVAERLGLSAAPGLREALAGSVALERAVQPTEQPHLFALSAGAGEGGMREEFRPRFVAQTMRSLLRQLRAQFHLIFVDGPTWEGRPDGMMLDAACDAMYLVLPEQEAETPRIDAMFQRISEGGGRLAGCILVAESSPSS